MIKYICPVCDKVMKGKHYCTSCRSWVKEPNITKIDYYLNERHPREETDCEYHNEFMHPTSAGAKKTAKPGTGKVGTDSFYEPRKSLSSQSKPIDPMLEIGHHMQNVGRKFSSSMHMDLNTFGRTTGTPQGGKTAAGWIAVGIFLLFSFFSSCT